MQPKRPEPSLPRVAVIGTGYWGKNLVRNFHAIGSLDLICDTDTDHLGRIQCKFVPGCRISGSFSDVLTDPAIHAVAIATPAETHATLVREALIAGKDVYVEKPLCLSVTEGQTLVDLARANDRILMVGHLLWYHPAVLKLKELIDEGELGRVEYIYSNRLNLGKIRREENILWSFAPHDISVILGLLNEMPDSVDCHGGNYLHPQISDVTVSNFSFPSGVKAHIFVSWLHPFKEQKLVVVGDKQMAVFDDVQKENKLVLCPHSVIWKRQIPVASKAEAVPMALDWQEPLRAECLHFLQCVRDRQLPRTDGEEGLRVLSVLAQCQIALTRPAHAARVGEPGAGDGKPVAHATPSPRSAHPSKEHFAHDSAFIDEGVEIGAGTKIWHVSHIMRGSRVGKDCRIGQNVVVGPNADIGDGVKIQNNVSVYEGVTLEDHVFCGPSMVFTNVFNPRSEIAKMDELRPTLVKRGATLGANCTILCGVTIGRYAFIGAGAVVTRDIPDHALVIGSPGKIADWVCDCGEKLIFYEKEATCPCGRKFIRNEGGIQPHGQPMAKGVPR